MLVRITNFVPVPVPVPGARAWSRGHAEVTRVRQLDSGIAVEESAAGELAAEEIVQLPMRDTNPDLMPA